MNFEMLKIGFISYLEEKTAQRDENEQLYENPDISIFMYSDEFKNYLVDEIGADSSIFSKSITDIMQMDFENGKLVERKTETNADSFEKEESENDDFMVNVLNEALQDENVIMALDTDKSGGLNKEKVDTFLTGLAETNENGEINFDNLAQSVQNIQQEMGSENENPMAESSSNIINRLLEKVYENKTALKALDIDGDGELSDEEKAKFEEFIKGYDGNSDELTEADIKRAFDDIMEGKFSYEADLTEKAEQIDEETEAELEEKAEAAQSGASTGGTTGTSGTSSTGGVSSTGATAGSSNSFSNSNSVEPKSLENMTLEELESERTSRQNEVNEARQGINDVYSGENDAVKSAQDDYDSAKEAYDAAVENDDKISDDLKERRNENLDAIEAQQSIVDNLKININDQEAKISDQQAVVAEDESNLSALESARSALNSQSSDDPDKQAEIDAKKAELDAAIQEAEDKLEEDEGTLESYENELTELEEQLTEEESALADLETERAEIEEEISLNCSEETKDAMKNFNEAKENVTKVKESELKAAQSTLTEAQSALDEVNNQINIKKAEQTEKENSVSDFDFDFELTLSDEQEYALELFKENWEENKDKYEAVEEATGMPAELVAAIHWRESGGNFDTYLHNGQPLGQTTTAVPKGIYFEDWTEAAIDAVTNYGTDLSTIDPNDIETYYNYAEHYNGMGYANKGLPSPYVWAGTSNYTSGKYVADGVFDPNYVDQQLGVAVMLQALLE